MDITRLNERISVAPQIRPDDMAALAKAGFRAVICNRPDDEEQHQPSAQSMAQAAQAAGLAFVHLPAVSSALTDQNAADMAQALESLPSPVLAYCRSGTRSTLLWSLAEASRGADPAELAAQAGLDPAACVYVGDAERDVQAALAAGMTALVAHFGYLADTDRPDTWGAHGSVHSMADIATWLGLPVSDAVHTPQSRG